MRAVQENPNPSKFSTRAARWEPALEIGALSLCCPTLISWGVTCWLGLVHPFKVGYVSIGNTLYPLGSGTFCCCRWFLLLSTILALWYLGKTNTLDTYLCVCFSLVLADGTEGFRIDLSEQVCELSTGTDQDLRPGHKARPVRVKSGCSLAALGLLSLSSNLIVAPSDYTSFK